jgi:filamentous hemagglutinin family protein
LPTFVGQTITSSGLNPAVSAPIALPSGQTRFDITGGTRPGGGGNLFHSFGNFNVPNNNIANFLNSTGLPTSNILGRVTGGNISNIFGTIQTTGFGSANLFLMNPAGFLFGPNATLNVGGMVAFTSADYLRLADGARFNALPKASADVLLTAAPVAAFGFLGSNPVAITVQGSQALGPGHISVHNPPQFIIPHNPSQGGLQGEAGGISLVGGDITVKGGAVLNAPGGNMTLVSVGKPSNPKAGGEVSVAGTTTGFATMGNVTISQGSAIRNGNSLFDPDASKGTILIRGGQVVLDTATIDSTQTKGRAPTPNRFTADQNRFYFSTAVIRFPPEKITFRSVRRLRSAWATFEASAMKTIMLVASVVLTGVCHGCGPGERTELDALQAKCLSSQWLPQSDGALQGKTLAELMNACN